ncbi:glycosyltransferase family protein [Oerskovia merdavium]|nr:glycosyltransferase [Oerskovia merdavium]
MASELDRLGDSAQRGPGASKPQPKTHLNIPTANGLAFPPFQMNAGAPRRPGLNVAVILDEFSAAAFAPEWNQHAVTPEGWRVTLDTTAIDLLFVESAWNGNDGAWLYHVVGTSAPRPALVDLIQECGRRGIPTVFWNKEDPPHFEDFLETAQLFDHVFTTDVNCVDEYKKRLGHQRVGVLPFAAQARYHNPARPGKVHRDLEVAFGGMYFRHKYPERREQLDYLLPAAKNHKLDIYSRHLGKNEDYRFPAPFDESVRGSLAYPEMLMAYHRYKVFINVNSVVDSPSMCARRIFEVTASGASIVSPPSPAIDTFFPTGEIATAGDQKSAKHAFRGLLRSEEYRQRQVHIAQRRIWSAHTYTHRVAKVLESASIPDSYRTPSVSILVPTVRPANVEEIFRNVARQSAVNPELVLLTHGFEIDAGDAARLARQSGVENLVLLSAERSQSLGAVLNRMVDAASGDLVSKMDDDDYYGPHYLEDLRHAHYFADAEIVGKAASYIYFQSRNATVINYESHEHRYTDFVRGATLTGSRAVFREIGFEDRRSSEDSTFLRAVSLAGGRIYAADRFNFVINRNAAPGAHTWTVGDDELFASGRFVMTGSPREHVSI